MSAGYRAAALAAAAAVLAALTGIAVGPDRFPVLLLVAAAGGPAAAGLAVHARLGERLRLPALLGGATIGPVVTLATHAAVGAFTYAFVLGFADAATRLADTLQVDPRLIDALSSPWVLALLVSAVVVAPLTEEAAKGLGARLAVPDGRRAAFAAGVAAGVGFAIVENLLYAGLGSVFGGAWPEIALERSLGAAVHPLASGLVVLGWWDARAGRRFGLLRGYLAGVAVHAVWNGSLVALAVVETAFELGGAADPLTTAGFGYVIVLALAAAAGLWKATRAVAADADPLRASSLRDGRAAAAWTLLAASVLVPVTTLIIAFPDFYRG